MTAPHEIIEVIGFLAGGMTVTAFYCKRMVTLRSAAIGANILFIAYGYAMGLKPVLLLHCVLLPLNIARLIGSLQHRRQAVHAELTPHAPIEGARAGTRDS